MGINCFLEGDTEAFIDENLSQRKQLAQLKSQMVFPIFPDERANELKATEGDQTDVFPTDFSNASQTLQTRGAKETHKRESQMRELHVLQRERISHLQLALEEAQRIFTPENRQRG